MYDFSDVVKGNPVRPVVGCTRDVLYQYGGGTQNSLQVVMIAAVVVLWSIYLPGVMYRSGEDFLVCLCARP